uniref:Cysteine proteinase n=1 Tax=Rhizophora mucronata TaxID=61149 RepID=A0A2P2K4E7_RHIMU
MTQVASVKKIMKMVKSKMSWAKDDHCFQAFNKFCKQIMHLMHLKMLERYCRLLISN